MLTRQRYGESKITIPTRTTRRCNSQDMDYIITHSYPCCMMTPPTHSQAHAARPCCLKMANFPQKLHVLMLLMSLKGPSRDPSVGPLLVEIRLSIVQIDRY